MKHSLTQCIKGGSIDGRAGYIISFNYDSEVVERIKTIPHNYREWRPDEKTWWISGEYENTLESLFNNFHALAHLQGQLL